MIGSVVDKVLQDVVEKLHGVGDELLIVLPLVEVFEIERRKTADRRTVMRGRQENFRAEIGAVNAQSLVLKPRRKRSVGGVNEDQIGLTRMHAHLKDALPQITRVILWPLPHACSDDEAPTCHRRNCRALTLQSFP